MKTLFIIDTLSGQRNGQTELVGKFVDATPEFIAQTLADLWANEAGDAGTQERFDDEVDSTSYYHDVHSVQLYTAREAMKLGFDADDLRGAWEFADVTSGRVRLAGNAWQA